jgi:hypothetical protein
MAMLLLLPAEWKQFSDNPIEYPAHKALGRVQRESNMRALEKMVQLDAKAWASFVDISKLYNHHSHAGALTMMMHIKLEWPYRTIMGGEYDRARKDHYADDLRRARSGAKTLASLSEAIGEHLRSATKDAPQTA